MKVLRPGVRERFLQDLDRIAAAARLAEGFIPSLLRLKPTSVVDRLRRSITLEMDFRMEAAAISEFADLTSEDKTFSVPKVHWEQSGRDVLTIDWVDEMPLSLYLHHFAPAAREAGRDKSVDEAYADYASLNPKRIAQNLMCAFLHQALVAGLFHADMHPGNLFVDRKSNLIGIDFGIIERMDQKQRRFLAEILYGFITGDYPRVAEVHFEAGYVPPHHRVEDFAMACRAIADPIRGQKSTDISMAKLLSLLFEVTHLFDMETRPELLLLHKTMVTVEGVCRELDPHFDMWKTSEPVLKQWMEGNFRPDHQLREAGKEAAHLVRQLGTLPELLRRGAALSRNFAKTSERGLSLDPETIDRLTKALQNQRPFFAQPTGMALLIALGFALGFWL